MNGNGGLLSSCIVSYVVSVQERRCERAKARKMVRPMSLKAGIVGEMHDGHEDGFMRLRRSWTQITG